MKFQPDWTRIRQRSLFVASPLYANSMTFGFHDSMMKLLNLCMKQSVRMAEKSIGCDSLVPRARNRLVAHYLDYDASDFLFVDADIKFSPEDALSLLSYEEPIIGGVYPRKQLDWTRIREAAIAGVPASKLPRYGFIPVANWLPGDYRIDELMEVRHLGTGFLRIRREVFTSIIQKLGPGISFDYSSDEEVFKGKTGYDMFPSGPDTRYPQGSGGRQYLSEDWGWSEMVRGLGYKLYAAPWIKLTHSGYHDFEGDMGVMDETMMEQDSRG